ncbi:M90 family metallopeptidase [Brumimicrobium aurantiacum]|uniref:Peptidase n=1 Tax=Brumimicrobium aurantiacum TaxID=1737063 RepID=A0A3E1F1Y1_9FLAO|nr:M90 family metallopeptidase [Brumimicrobium aurantiacum]RFC55816.1 peptidase [Brumimicrobium aurantiacum]
MKDLNLYLLTGLALGLFIGYRKLKDSRQKFHNSVKPIHNNNPKKPFPGLWRQILQDKVNFYSRLTRDEKTEFERKVHVFLLNVRIRGMETEVSHEDKILIAAGAVIPVFRFSSWNYANLKEVQLYPDKFQIPDSNQMAHGLVGWGAKEGIVMLSRKSVHEGFHDNTDHKNVVIHEFIHVLDMQDGKIDGVLGNSMNDVDLMPWLHIINIKMNEIDFGTSSIRDYGAANRAEFLAVVSEFFFENPERLRVEHPGLYNALDAFYAEK